MIAARSINSSVWHLLANPEVADTLCGISLNGSAVRAQGAHAGEANCKRCLLKQLELHATRDTEPVPASQRRLNGATIRKAAIVGWCASLREEVARIRTAAKELRVEGQLAELASYLESTAASVLFDVERIEDALRGF